MMYVMLLLYLLHHVLLLYLHHLLPVLHHVLLLKIFMLELTYGIE